MGQSPQELKWVENEVIFRQANEEITRRIASTKAVAAEEDQEATIRGIDDITLQFYCECADEKCRRRISLTPKEYAEQHRNKSQFVLIPGHHIPQVERVLFERDNYVVVEKYVTPPDDVGKN